MLQQLGVGDLFDATADLSGLAPQGHVHLDDAVHKAKIEVDEQGKSGCMRWRNNTPTISNNDTVIYR